MRAYYIAMFLIVFNLSLPVLNAVGVFRPITPQTLPLESPTMGNIATIILAGSGMLAAIAGVIFRVNVGAIIFAMVFSVSSLPLAGTINTIAAPYMFNAEVLSMIEAVTTMLSGILAFVFIYAFIQLSGVFTGD